eukprot:TRINITY_DN3549_c0_g1_i1.p1 TRINITY_DN3549_c0_g1~~TRINITY_DN3549_c0_g1_i1.p1  ORF type:complete len:473 (+),score=124.94 TRINITY_DN3549_c0_g1_i1:49-1467(+)
MATTIYATAKQFKWELIANHIQKQGLLKYKASLKKGWDKRWVVLHYNYLLVFKSTKEPTKKDEPKTVIPLEMVEGPKSIEMLRDDKSGSSVRIHCGAKDYFITPDNDPAGMQAWFVTVQSVVEKLKAGEQRQSTDRVLDRLMNARKVFKENGLKLPKTVKANEAEEWITNLKMYKEEYPRWSPFFNSCLLWSEVMTSNEDNFRYVKWFTNKTNGVWEQIENNENMILASWQEGITKSYATLQDALENNFFLEDMKKPLNEAEQFKKLIDFYSEAKNAINGERNAYFVKEKQKIDQIIAACQRMPSMTQVSLTQYEGGSMKTDQSYWIFDKFTYVLKNENITATIVEPVTWECKEMSVFKNQIYGFIIWNTKNWVWTHPKIPFMIKYNWEPTRSVFFQVIPPKDPSKSKPQPPSLTDWQIKDGGIQAVTVGKKDTPPQVPKEIFWSVKGKLPPPVMLLAVTHDTIRNIVRGHM